jgi:hypothetical protein
MGESWGKRDIFFPQVVTVAETMAGNLTSTRKPIIGNPFVHQSFGMVGSSGGIAGNEPTPVKSPLLRYDGCLLSLGIILVELWFGTCLENLPEYLQMRDNSSYQISDNAEFHTADQLIERIEEEAGTMYGGAVRRCIRGLDHSATSLTHEGFKNEVQVKVIAELERNWKIYARRN